MKLNSSWRIKTTQILLGVMVVLVLLGVRSISAGNDPVHLATDWSHRHVVFSAPRDLAQRVSLMSNPRFMQQVVRRNAEDSGHSDDWRWRRAPETTNGIHGDWSMDMGPGATAGAGNYPAKFSFDATTAKCGTDPNPDFVVFNTSLAGSAIATDATRNGTFTGLSGNSTATALQRVTITNGATSLILYSNTGASATAAGTVTGSVAGPNAGDTVTVGPVGATRIYTFVTAGTTGNDVLRGANSTAAMGNLRAAINDNAGECVTAAPCFGTGITTANAAGTATIAARAVTITAPAAGSADNFTLTSSNGGRLAISGAAGTGGAGSNAGVNFLAVTSATTTATNLAAAINRVGNGSSVGVSATSAAGVVSITATTAGPAGDAITLAETLTNFTFAGTTLAGGGNPQANIGAFDNLYSGCGAPSVFWAYSTGGSVVTSPAISFDGTQVAFVQNVGTTANLVLLKWAASGSASFTAPVALTTQANAAAYRACTAPCMFTIAFSGTAATDTNSAPFYDFNNDTIFVGDDSGRLRKFTGVFNGPPAEITIGGFPATLTTGNVATSPVVDDNVGLILVADGTPAGMGDGQLYSVNETTGAVIKSIELSRGVGFADGPILDYSSGNVYLFTADNTGATCGTTENAVITMPATFTATTVETATLLSPNGVCSPTLSIYDGTFDNAYYSGSGPGHLYVCGNIGGAPSLYQVPVSATGVLGTTATAGPALAASGNTCGPVTEVFNTSTSKDWIFTDVQGGAVAGGVVNCGTVAGCVMSFDVTSGVTISPATPTVGHVTAAGGSSAVIVDNTVATGTLAGASQVYFTPLADQVCTTSGGTGGCAIQASQSGLN